MRSHAVPAALLFALVSGCAAPSVKVVQSGPRHEARRPDCRVEFYRLKPVERPFDEVAVILYESRHVGILTVQELMRARACAAGADAVVVTREYTPLGGMAHMVGTAIRYRDLDEKQRRLLDVPRDMAAEIPPGYKALAVKAEATVHPDPYLKKPAIAKLEKGAVVWTPITAVPFRPPFWEAEAWGTEVYISSGQSGYVHQDLLAPHEPSPGEPSKKPGAELPDGAI